MSRRRLSVLGLALAAAWALSSPGHAGEAWESKPASAWTEEETLELLKKSPWTVQVELLQTSGRQLARFANGTVAVYRNSPDSPPRVFDQEPVAVELEYVRGTYAVRWSSARVVQEALKRLGELSPVMKEMQAEAPELPPDALVLTARVVTPPSEETAREFERRTTQVPDEVGRPTYDEAPKVGDIFAGLDEAALKERATLTTARKLQLKPARVVRHGIGTAEGISFFFPRDVNGGPTLPAGTAWAEFVLEGRKRDKLKARFKMKDMVYQGKADY
jgi:hypothetical protein